MIFPTGTLWARNLRGNERAVFCIRRLPLLVLFGRGLPSRKVTDKPARLSPLSQQLSGSRPDGFAPEEDVSYANPYPDDHSRGGGGARPFPRRLPQS